MALKPYLFVGRSDDYDHITVEPALDNFTLRRVTSAQVEMLAIISASSTLFVFDKSDTVEAFDAIVEKMHHIIGGTCVKGFGGHLIPMPLIPARMNVNESLATMPSNN